VSSDFLHAEDEAGDDGAGSSGEGSESAGDSMSAGEELTSLDAAAAKGKGARASSKAKKKTAEVEPLELLVEATATDVKPEMHWYILKVQVNREDSIRDALIRKVKQAGLEEYFGEIVVPTEDVAEFSKAGKRKVVKRKLYPGYIMARMAINDDTWFAVRETPGIGDFTGSAGKPTPMEPREVERILKTKASVEEEGAQVKTSIPFVVGDHVRVKEGNFQNFEGDVDKIDEAHGLITVVIPIFNRPTPVEIPHWQIERA
jgi:transcriptional antiterminator NusG